MGPMLSAMTGIRAIDAGLPQLSMHSIRATTGSLDPGKQTLECANLLAWTVRLIHLVLGLGVKLFAGFFDHFEAVDTEFI